jgi:hypothetical protein
MTPPPPSDPRTDPPPTLTPGRRPDRPTIGRKIGAVATALGTPLMPWQGHAAAVGGERLPDGRPAYPVVVVSVPRQAGKSALGHAVCVEGMTARPDARVWSTAQTRNAARDRWMDGARAMKRSAAFGPVTDLRLANGSESIGLPNGGLWRPFAPLPDALHGETTTRVMLDEGWAFDRVRGTELLQAIIPTGATVPEFQLWIVSAAGDDDSEFLADLLAGADAAAVTGAGIAVIAWQAVGAATAPDIVQAVIDAHPAVGHTMTGDAVRAAREAMPNDAEFLRAFGNVFTATASGLFVAADTDPLWIDAAGAPTQFGALALAVDVAPDRSTATISAAWSAPGVGDTGAIIGHGAGTGWVVAAAAGLTRRYGVPVAVDPIGPGAGLADDLRRAGVPIRVLTTREVTTAAVDLLEAVKGGTIRLYRDDALAASLAVAGRRQVGRDAWAFDRRGGAGDITPVVSLANAVSGLRRPAPMPYLI